MEATSRERKIIDIGATVARNEDIVPNIVAAHVISGCDTVAQYHGNWEGIST